MNSLALINRVKYSKTIYRLYNYVGSRLVSFLKFFLRPNCQLIIFASFGGRKYDDSPRAIYEAMLDDKRFDNCRLVWAFMQPEHYNLPRGEKVRIDTLQYYKTLLRARVWVTNSSMTRGLSFTGINSYELNSWHGSAIKRMGGDINVGNKSFSLKGKKKNIGVMLAQGQYDVDVFSRAFNMSPESFRVTGLPRNDVLAQATEQLQYQLREKLDIEPGKKVILYAPTFREYEKDSGNNCVMVPPMNLKKWKEKLGKDYVLLFRAHYEVARVLGIKDDDFVRNVSSYPSLDDLMLVSDMLVSDYSSIFFDYAIMHKPMISYCYDYDQYATERGMYFDIREWLPNAAKEDELIELIKQTDTTQKNKATVAFQKEFVTEYGNATRQALDIICQKIC